MKAIESCISIPAVLEYCTACSATPNAAAQEYPTRPIRFVVPWPPGGITDVIARSLAATLTDSLGQQLVPDNRPGAAGTLGVGIAAKANADGYTLLMTDVPSHAISASLYTKLPYDPAQGRRADCAAVAIAAGARRQFQARRQNDRSAGRLRESAARASFPSRRPARGRSRI